MRFEKTFHVVWLFNFAKSVSPAQNIMEKSGLLRTHAEQENKSFNLCYSANKCFIKYSGHKTENSQPDD